MIIRKFIEKSNYFTIFPVDCEFYDHVDPTQQLYIKTDLSSQTDIWILSSAIVQKLAR